PESCPGACDDFIGLRGRGFDLVLRGPQGRPACFAPVLSLVLGPERLCWTHEGSIHASWSASTGGREVHSRVGRSNAAASRGSGRPNRSISFARRLGLVVLRGFLYRCRVRVPQPTPRHSGNAESTRIQYLAVDPGP